MKVISKTLALGTMAITLAACGDADENNNNNVEAPNNNADGNNVNEDVNNGDDPDNNGMDNDDSNLDDNDNDLNNEMNDNESNDLNDDGEAAGQEGELPVTIDEDAEDGQLVFEKDGEEYSKDAEVYETEFGKEVKILEGMDGEHLESGNRQTADFTVEDESHEMYGLTFTVEEAFTYEGDTVVVQDVDLERSQRLETALVENAGHVDNFEAYSLEDESTPFQFYFEIEGDASNPGQWSDAVAGEDYKEYRFFEIVEEGKYTVVVRFPADVDEEFEATALAMALSYGPEGTTAEFDDDEMMDEEEMEDDEE